MKKLACLFVALLLEAMPASAANAEFSFGATRFSISIPENWTTLKEVMGVPVLLVGPLVEGRRPSIAISPTDLDTKQFSLEQLRASEAGYRKEKEEFLVKANGKLQKFFPYEKSKWGKGIDVHTLAVQYEVGGHEFVDRTYYLSCKGRMIHIKTLTLADQERQILDQVEAATHSFRCR